MWLTAPRRFLGAAGMENIAQVKTGRIPGDTMLGVCRVSFQCSGGVERHFQGGETLTRYSLLQLFTHPSIHLPYLHQPIYPPPSYHIPLPTHPLIYCHPSIQLPIPPPIYNLIHSSLCPPTHPSVHPFTYPSILPLFIHSFFLTSLFPSSIHLSN